MAGMRSPEGEEPPGLSLESAGCGGSTTSRCTSRASAAHHRRHGRRAGGSAIRALKVSALMKRVDQLRDRRHVLRAHAGASRSCRLAAHRRRRGHRGAPTRPPLRTRFSRHRARHRRGARPACILLLSGNRRLW